MSRIFSVYFWSAIGILSNLLVVPLYTHPLADAYAIVGYIVVVQSLATTLDFGLNALVMRDACTDKNTKDIMAVISQIDIIFIFLWCCGFIAAYVYFFSSNINFYLLSASLIFFLTVAGVFRLLIQFQRSVLYATGRQVVATKVLALCATLKLVIPYPFLNFGAEDNATIYLAVYAIMNVTEYCFLRQINGGLFSNPPNIARFLEFVSRYRVSIVSLFFASIVLTVSTQIEKTASWTQFPGVNLAQAAYSLQFSGLMLVAFGPISQILQPAILSSNIEFNISGLRKLIWFSFTCQFLFTLIAVFLLWLTPNIYRILTNNVWDMTSSTLLFFLVFLALMHIQNSFMYYYNTARNRLAHQPFYLTMVLALDLVVFVNFSASLWLFVIVFCSVRFYVSNVIFLFIHRENLGTEFMFNFVLNHICFVALVWFW